MHYSVSLPGHWDLAKLIEERDVQQALTGTRAERSWAHVNIMYEAVRISSRHDDPLRIALDVIRQACGEEGADYPLDEELAQRIAQHQDTVDSITRVMLAFSHLEPNM